jgi:hypothetical protein
MFVKTKVGQKEGVSYQVSGVAGLPGAWAWGLGSAAEGREGRRAEDSEFQIWDGRTSNNEGITPEVSENTLPMPRPKPRNPRALMFG